jgi:hypothetical protein
MDNPRPSWEAKARQGFDSVKPDPFPPDQRGDAYEGPGPGPSANGRKKARPEKDPEPPPAVESFTAAELDAMELPLPRWAVYEVVPEGLTILAGKPKLGKSWLALNLALAVAYGGKALGCIGVDKGSVLYLALEDNKRRLKKRMRKIMSKTQAKAPHELTMVTTCPRLDSGGKRFVVDWLETHPDTRLVIVDTWGKFRPSRIRNADLYEEDYSHASTVKALADQYAAAVLLVDHCRKMDSTDPVDSVRGSIGSTGAADAVLILKRERGQHDAALFVTGRDLEEQELALTWDAEYCLWSVAGPAEEFRRSRERSQLLNVLQQSGRPMTPTEIAPVIDKKPDAVRKLLWSMCNDGQVRSLGNGRYIPGNVPER